MQSLNPTDDSGVTSIVPAVPSPSGVADVFAFLGNGTVQAITSYGTTAWTANPSQGSTCELPQYSFVPDFQGGLVGATWSPGGNGECWVTGIAKVDGAAGQSYPVFTNPSDPNAPFYAGDGMAVHPDGTIFAILQGGPPATFGPSASVVGIDPAGGGVKFSVPIPESKVGQFPAGGIIIAGDGYAYVPHWYADVPWPCYTSGQLDHLMLLRVGSDGSYTDFDVSEWASYNSCHEGMIAWVNGMITNADQGIVLSWQPGDGYDSYLAAVTGGSAAVVSTPGNFITPVLQLQDGSFAGTASDSEGNQSMIDFDASGNVLRRVGGNWQPQIATADGGLIATDQDSGAAITFDQNGNATGSLSFLSKPSWTGNAYEGPPAQQVQVNSIPVATTFCALLGGNLSHNGTAAKQANTLQGPEGKKFTYTGSPQLDCDRNPMDPPVPVFYGYQECESYTVLDGRSPPQQIKRGGIKFDEKVKVIKASSGGVPTTGPGWTNDKGILRDNLTFGFPDGPVLNTDFSLEGQTITLHSTATTVRVNCLDFEQTDVTVTDITSTPDFTKCTRSQ